VTPSTSSNSRQLGGSAYFHAARKRLIASLIAAASPAAWVANER